MKKASREMGFGDDWKKAVEKVKTMYVPPGEQPDLIRDLALEADGLCREPRYGHRPGRGAGKLADGNDVAAAAAGESVLPRRRNHQISYPTDDGVRREDGEHARQQHALLACHRFPRADPRP